MFKRQVGKLFFFFTSSFHSPMVYNTVEYAKAMLDGENDVPDLSWFNVAIASLFILVNGITQ
jgi:hypothetical protein